MATITSIGTGSGIDLEGLVGQILEAERAPKEQRLAVREATAEASISAFGSLKSALDTLRSTLQDLSDEDETSTRTASSSDGEYVSVSASNTALVGRHDIQVLSLASNHKLASGDFVSPASTVGHGTLSIAVGNSSFEVEISEGENDSLAGIRDAIREAAGEIGISVSLITVDNGQGDGGTVSKLVLSADEGGEDNKISISVLDSDGTHDDGDGLSQLAYDPENPPAGGEPQPPLNESLRPDGETFQATGFSGTPTFGVIDDDPDSSDGDFLVSSSKNTTVALRTSFENPSRELGEGANLQEIRVEARQRSNSGTGTPTLNIEIYEQGGSTPIYTSSSQDVTSKLPNVYSFTFDASILNDLDGSNFEVVVNGVRSGGNTTQRAAVDIGAVEFNSFSAATNPGQMSEISEAKDARITVDGFMARSSTNNFSDVLEGVEITALRKPEDAENPETASISIEESATDVRANLDSFINSYNEVFITISSLTAYDTESQTAGLLTSDAGVRQIETLLRRTLFDQIGDSSSKFRNLASIGLTTERDGTLSLNSARLQSAIDEGLPAITDLLTGSSGIMSRLETLVDGFVASDGVIKSRTDGLNTQLESIADQRERLELRLQAVEARFRRQFAGLDTLIAQLQSTGNFLTQELSNIASIRSSR